MADRTITKGFIDPTFQVRNLLQRFLGLLYHGYYYILMFVSIIGLFPWLFHYSKHDKDFPSFYRFGRLWSALILNGMGLVRKVTYEADIPWYRPYVVVANHKKKKQDLTVTPEFGPAPYMPLKPYSQKPISKQWDINVFMMELFKARYK